MSGLETSAVAISAVALLVAVVLAGFWRRARRDLRELRSTVDGLTHRVESQSRTDQTRAEVAEVSHLGALEPSAGDPVATLLQPRRERPSQRADAIVTSDGRTIVVPTTAQVVDATMGRPLVRASALAHGLRRALRPEHRDRIRALMRREFQRRRKMRQRAARRAARMAPVHQAGEETSG
jgi:hypothetical protein